MFKGYFVLSLISSLQHSAKVSNVENIILPEGVSFYLQEHLLVKILNPIFLNSSSCEIYVKCFKFCPSLSNLQMTKVSSLRFIKIKQTDAGELIIIGVIYYFNLGYVSIILVS